MHVAVPDPMVRLPEIYMYTQWLWDMGWQPCNDSHNKHLCGGTEDNLKSGHSSLSHFSKVAGNNCSVYDVVF